MSRVYDKWMRDYYEDSYLFRYPAYNSHFQSSFADITRKAVDKMLDDQAAALWDGLSNAGVSGMKSYLIYNSNGSYCSSHDTETEATAKAEALAKTHNGVSYYVYKAITKSHVAPAPSITTRL